MTSPPPWCHTTVVPEEPKLHRSSWKATWRQVALDAATPAATCGLEKIWTCTWKSLDRIIDKEEYARFYAPAVGVGQVDAPGCSCIGGCAAGPDGAPLSTYWWEVPTYEYSLPPSVGTNPACAPCQPTITATGSKWVPAVLRPVISSVASRPPFLTL